LLHFLARFSPIPCLCVGDFNKIINLTKKIGAVNKPNCQIEDFKNALEDSQLSDLGFRGPNFPWNNGGIDHGFTNEQLDRAVANKEWCEFYGEVDCANPR